MKNLIKLTALIAALSLCSCNHIARVYGGSVTVELEKDQKLINASWKEDSLWILTRVRKADESVETYQYKESSTFGMLEGTVTIVEK
jgi:hypothetical protein